MRKPSLCSEQADVHPVSETDSLDNDPELLECMVSISQECENSQSHSPSISSSTFPLSSPLTNTSPRKHPRTSPSPSPRKLPWASSLLTPKGPKTFIDLTESSPEKSPVTAPVAQPIATSSSTHTSSTAMLYEKPIFRKNYLPGYPTTNCVRLEDLIVKEGLQRAVLTSFVVEMDWLLDKLPENIPICLVKHWNANQNEQPGSCRYNDKILMVHPPFASHGYGCFHAKLSLLYYPTFIRVIISSANYISYDWEVLENMVFCQDFPMKPTTDLSSPSSPPPLPTPSNLRNQTQPAVSPPRTQFGATLEKFLEHCHVPLQVRATLKQYDFSSATVHIVMSVPGYHSPKVWRNFGQASLANIIHQYVNSTGTRDPPFVEYVMSSIGRIFGSWLDKFYQATCGIEYNRTYKRKPKNALIKERFGIGFPSLQTVKDSANGISNGSSFFLTDSTFKHLGALSQCFRDTIALRPGCLLHTKLLIARHAANPDAVADTPPSWYYFGSHNLSPAAWGTYAQSKFARPGGSHDILRISNYELGIVNKIQSNPASDEKWELDSGFVPPFLSPAPTYAASDEPWIASNYL
ncbi:hypothetical protein IWQ62_004235 [Dispira parvispora]|uniref:Tyrosyl-DNA phosphodiesterase n=1 Tax=Dispira parvispora TaxID=1520584 RepID=A0A9W8AMB4_9FUNG|nr:hypothetical protein IWQ62_004235 [Dispira parvispora]